MKIARPLRQAIALATLLAACNLSAWSADIPLSKTLEADEVTIKALAVDTAKHQVVLKGTECGQVQVQLKVTHIDLKKNQVTLENPAGVKKVLSVEKPENRAGLKDLKVGQSVLVTFTDTLEITTAHEG